MKKYLKYGLLATGIGLLLLASYWIWSVMVLFGSFEQNYNKEDLIENYKRKEKEIMEVKRYAKSIIPKNKILSIEFESDSKLFYFHLSDENGIASNWDVDVDSKKADSLLKKLGWTKETFMTLKKKLVNANCTSIDNNNPFTIGYQRSGLGKYSYNLFEEPMKDSLKNEYNDGCTHILYNKKVALEFGGGAVGPQCFDKGKKNNELNF